MATVQDIQKIIFSYYPQCHDLKRTWECAREIADIFVPQRWIERYNDGRRYPCQHKGCIYKLRNGRCGRDMWRQEFDENNRVTDVCLDYSTHAADPLPPNKLLQTDQLRKCRRCDKEASGGMDGVCWDCVDCEVTGG